MAPLHEAEAGTVGGRRQIVLVDQRAEDDPGEVGQPDRDDVFEEAALPLHHQRARFDRIDQLDGAVAPGRTGEAEAQLVDGQAKILDLVIAEAEAAGETGSCDARQTEELRAGRDNESDFVGSCHDRRTVPPGGGPSIKTGIEAPPAGLLDAVGSRPRAGEGSKWRP